MDGALLEDFGQKVDLTRRIREVLVNYPEGTTVLKELIQNADDAGATKVCLCLDRRRHGSESLLSEKLAEWQGPALLAYNNAVFTEEDFVSISRIGDSKKHSQPWKTGRFGVGFNSVYHLTDLPSFVSSKYVVLFDPQGAYLPSISASNPGKRLDFVSSSAIEIYRDQFIPYCAFGCDMKKPFNGTLFRFPLRNSRQAAVSKLSRQNYLEDDISSLFSQLSKEATLIMLFLKSIVEIEMYIWDAVMVKPQKFYSCSIHSPDEKTAWHRQAILRLSNFSESKNRVTESYYLNLLSEEINGTLSEKKVSTFLIVQSMASPLSEIGRFAAAASSEHDFYLLPWASIAACITDHLPQDDALKQGRAFCFLPLPVRTGLSVQVNGYFEVSSNRRSIWFGDDMDRGGKLRSDWNSLLLKDVVAPSFNELLVHLAKLLGPTELYYSLWPTGTFEAPWNNLVDHIYSGICQLPVTYSNVQNGNWILPYEAFIHDKDFVETNDICAALLCLEMPVVHLPNSVIEMLSQYIPSFDKRKINPDTVRNFLKTCQVMVEKLNSHNKLMLLEYCLSDLVDADVGKHASGLPLLPLANGKFGTISGPSKLSTLFICNDLEYQLLDVVSDKLIDQNIPYTLLSRLSAIAKTCQTNIAFFNANCFLQFLPRFFPSEWKYKDMVPWGAVIGDRNPSASWFLLFWRYIQDHCLDLSLFDDWPIFPSVSGHLHRASKISKLINVGQLPESLKSLLLKIGCKILDPNYGITHKELSTYVHEADGAGLVNAIFEVISSDSDIPILFRDVTVEEKNELCKFLLDPKFYYGGNLYDFHTNKSKKLPIYRTYGGGLSHSFHFSNLVNPPKFLPPFDVPEYFFSDEFIYSSSHNEEEILQRYYGIERMRKTTFYKNFVLNRINNLTPEVRDAVMLNILYDLPQLSLSDASFKEQLRNLAFVPTASGNLKSPQSLYDPRVEELYALLEDCDSFPCGLFQEYNAIDMLHGLGLKTSVSYDTIIESACQIEVLSRKDQSNAHSRGKVLLSYLEVNALKWLCTPMEGKEKVNRMFKRVSTAFSSRDNSIETDLEKFWNNLRLISWCPVLIASPYEALPWPSVSSVVAPPKLVRLQEDLWLVSASMRILDGECSSSALSFSLGWSSPPSGSAIAAQLLELGKNNEIVSDKMLRQELTVAMPRIYSLLTSMIGSDEMDLVKAVLEGSRWVWVGDGFATVQEVVLDGQFHLAPYIRVIPVDLAVFRELFIELGIREFMQPTDYANILRRMANRRGCGPLNTQELRTAVLVLQHLSDLQFHDLDTQIYLPDTSSRLFPAKDLVYNDAPWLLDIEEDTKGNPAKIVLNEKQNIRKYVHGNISNDVADRLGVCSLRRLLLAQSSDTMNLGLTGVAEAFGQHESLTTRLKHIVEMYADGPGILFELVQNAEDAGASEVVFLLDKTHYGTSSTLSPQMAEWQGPALYCFNDSIFSAQDLYAISRIGQDSKLQKPFSIGRFGLGFNCVYHFTDVPGFVSGENIVIFDPHACNLPGISPSHPGLRIKFVGRKILEQFPDQFTPFLQFGCDLQHPFSGTLFRFPLRGEVTASRSEIKKEKYAPEDVRSLFSSFSEVVSETLLFLRKINKISIYVKDGLDHDMQLIHSVSRHTVVQPEKELHPLYMMLNFRGNLKTGISKEQFFSKLQKTADKDLPWNCKKVAVVERNHFSIKFHVWMISEAVGGGRARSKSVSSAERSHNFIPWACVAAYLHSVDITDTKESIDALIIEQLTLNISAPLLLPTNDKLVRKDVTGRAFCFLPLPINTGLPAHVNAYFELSSNRRDIWFGNDMAGGGKIRSDWNICLLEDAVAPAYGRLLEALASHFGPSDFFFSFWPTAVGPEPWATMVGKLYSCITDLELRVLYTQARGGRWISTKHAIFPDVAFTNTHQLSEALSEAGLPLVTLPRPVVERFADACPSLHYLSPRFLRSLLIWRKRGFKNKEVTILVLGYCLDDMKEPNFSDNLLGLPLIPLSSGSFTMFSRRGEGEKVFITSPDEYGLLIDFFPYLVIDCALPEKVHQKLKEVALSSNTNVSLFTCESLLELFPRFFPAEWSHSMQVYWIPNELGQPSTDWMRLLWRFLKSSCNDLSVFMKWPILPVGDDCLIRLTRNSNVIRDDGWSENMSSLLRKLGCYILRSDLQIDHPQLKDFVQDATATGILDALQAVSTTSGDISHLFINISEGERQELQSFLFQSKWFPGLEPYHIDMIKLLPIFESHRGRKTISLTNPTKWIKPDGIPEDLLDDVFVRLESEREKEILRVHIGIKEPSKSEFYKNHVLKNMSEFLSQPSLLSTILLDLKTLTEDSSMKALLSEIPFVLAANGAWQCPSRLYDPRVHGLRKLLHREVFFPCDKFSDPETLETLGKLGLRRTLGFVGLLDSAKSVSMLHDSGDVNAIQCGRRLLSYLDTLGSQLSDDCREESQNVNINSGVREQDSDLELESPQLGSNFEYDLNEINELSCLETFASKEHENGFWEEMRTIAWCPVYTNPPKHGLPWFKSERHLAPPNMIRPRNQMWLVSSTMRVLDGECHSTYVQEKLGWMDTLDIHVLSSQLVELSKTYVELNLNPDHEPHAELQKEIHLLYSKLQEFIGTDSFSILKNAVSGISWVWVGDTFVSPKTIAFDSPVKYHPYLYVVPSELSDFRKLLLELGVKVMFEIPNYLDVLQNLQHDLDGKSLSTEQLSFVNCVLESIAECLSDRPPSHDFMSSLLIPDSSGNLLHSVDLVYNDAPWMDRNNPAAKKFVHTSITEDLARRLGVKSLRSLSLVDDEMVMDLPCMDYSQICNLLALYGDSQFLFFDLLELADCCKAKKLHLIYDKRKHPQQSLLQHNFGEFQGPSLLVVMEGTRLSREEICNFQFPPPWNLNGTPLTYGLGLLSCHFVCDLLSVVSSGCLYMFDPLGLVLASASNNNPSAKMFSLIGTNLTKRFRDQFQPMLINEDMSSLSRDSTIIRMPLSSKYMNESEPDSKRIKQIFDHFTVHASSALLFLKSVLQVSISTWEKDSPMSHLDFSVSITPSSAVMRNPFAGKKWRKFHISRLFSSSHAATKLHVLDLHVYQDGVHVTDKWLTSLSLGSGQTRNMALDRQYLSYNLTPVAGVAVHLSREGQPVYGKSSSCILCPLPLSGDISMPVTAMGCFLVCHNGGRYLFSCTDSMTESTPQFDVQSKLVEAWNRELMSCISDSYVELVLEFQKIRKDPSTSSVDSANSLSSIFQAYGDQVYTFWPRSKSSSSKTNDVDDATCFTNTTVADWLCLVEQVIRPFYMRLVDLPVWQLYRGDMVKANEGMFLCQSGNRSTSNLPPLSVCNFIREHYPVFSVPTELVSEIQAVGVKVREIKPKMVRDLLKTLPSLLLHSMETYLDVLDYSFSDIPMQHFSTVHRDNKPGIYTNSKQLEDSHTQNTSMLSNGSPSSSNSNSEGFYNTSAHTDNPGNDALEIVSSLGKALYDFGRGVVEDIGRGRGPFVQPSSTKENTTGSNLRFSMSMDLKGTPFPTASMSLARLGINELWIGSKEQQILMHRLLDKFIHPKCLEHPTLAEFLSIESFHSSLNLKVFSLPLLSTNYRFLFGPKWTSLVMDSKETPWFTWENGTDLFGEGPSAEWVQLFWKVFKDLNGDLSLVYEWPLIPAYLGRPILCRARYHDLIFVPPISEPSNHNGASSINPELTEMIDTSNNISVTELNNLYLTSFNMVKSEYSWLFALLNRCNIPTYDMPSFIDSTPRDCIPVPGQTMGQIIASKLLAAKRANLLSKPEPFPDEDRDRLFTLFAEDFCSSNGSGYARETLDLLREFPIFRTTLGGYTELHGSNHCLVSPSGFFHPTNEWCLAFSDVGAPFLHAIGVHELQDEDVLIRFALPGFEGKSSAEQEDILIYIFMNWESLQLNFAVVNTLRDTKFVCSAAEHHLQFFKPCDLFDPRDSLLSSVFSGDRVKFPGERFATDGWLKILKRTGLRTSSEAGMLVECARKLELLGKEASDYPEATEDLELHFLNTPDGVHLDIWSLAESVVVKILANLSVLLENKLCDLLGQIAFVPAEKGLPNIGGKKGGKRVLCSYNEAILLKDWPLAWSSAPILTKGNCIPPEFSWGAFHFRSPPAFSTVLKHLQLVGQNNGEDTLAHWPTLPGMLTVEDAACEVLKFLNKIWGALSSSDIAELQKVPFMPVANGTRCVTATSLFVRLTVNLSPFVFELSACYLPYMKILKDIGAQDVLTVSYAMDLLLNIQKSCGYQHLNPNELRAVMEILHFICDSIGQSRSDGLDWLSDAVIPDDGCRLVLARSCVYLDSYGSKILKNIDCSRIRFAHPELPTKMCITLNVKKLSDVIVEEVDNDLHIVDDIRSVTVKSVADKLCSRTFQKGVCIIVNSLASQIPSLNGVTMEEIQRTLETISRNIQFVKCIYTRFLFLPTFLDITRVPKKSLIPEWDGSAKHRSVYFVDRRKNRILISEPPSYMSIYEVIGIVVSHILDMPVTLPIASLLSSPDNSENAIINVLRLGSETGIAGCSDKPNILIGKELSPQDSLRVQFHPRRPFYNGEIVAWRVGKDGEKLKYGRVPQDVRPFAGQSLYRFPVETEPGDILPLLSSQVFSFNSVSMADGSLSFIQGTQNIEEIVFQDQAAGASGSSKTSRERDSQEYQFGKVTAAELVQAVQDMLSVAGINLDAEKKTLLETTLTLQERVEAAQIALLVEQSDLSQEKADLAAKEAEAAKAAWSCRICLSNEVSVTLIPCGHVLCLRCSSAVSRCPFCRAQVSKTVKIYRP